MKKIIYTLVLFSICFGSAQAQLNDYKYIIVPKQFDAFKKENQYLTSTLVKHLFIEKGFNTIYEDALPEELNNNRCLGLTAQIKDESNMFLTKTTLVLFNCQSQEVFTTQTGVSKEKEFKLSYGEAIREAFKSFNGISYSYTPAAAEKASKPVTVSFKDDVKQIQKDTVANEKKEVEAAKVIVAEKVAENKTTQDVVIRPQVTPEQPGAAVLESRSSDKKKAIPVEPDMPAKAIASEIWYAQQVPGGFQLVDSSPKVRLKMFKTSLANVYLSENDKGNGLVYEKNGQWFLEYYDGSNLKLEKLNIKF